MCQCSNSSHRVGHARGTTDWNKLISKSSSSSPSSSFLNDDASAPSFSSSGDFELENIDTLICLD